MRAYQSVFDNPKWMTLLLIGAVCILVPVVGAMVWLGYLFESVETMHRRQRDTWRDFDTNRLVPYLMRGLWVLIVNLILVVVLMPVVFLGYIALIGVTAATKEPLVGLLGVLCFIPLVLAISAALTMVTVPLSLRAGLSQDLGTAFNVAFVRDFIGRVWRQMLLAFLFMVVARFVVTLGGLLLCCVGAYPAAALIAMAHVHLEYQLYEEYLRAGGERIPLKEEGPGSPPAVLAEE